MNPISLIVLALVGTFYHAGQLSSDPVYVAQRYEQALAGVKADKALNCASSQGVFWVNPSSLVKVEADVFIVKDWTGQERKIFKNPPSPICIVQN